MDGKELSSVSRSNNTQVTLLYSDDCIAVPATLIPPTFADRRCAASLMTLRGGATQDQRSTSEAPAGATSATGSSSSSAQPPPNPRRSAFVDVEDQDSSPVGPPGPYSAGTLASLPLHVVERRSGVKWRLPSFLPRRWLVDGHTPCRCSETRQYQYTRSLRPNWFPCSARQEDSIWLCNQIKVKQLIVPLGAVDF